MPSIIPPREHHPRRKTILRYNPHYWKADKLGQRLPYLDEIVIHYIPQRDTQILRLEAGELDLLDAQVRPSDLNRLEGKAFQLLDAKSSVQLKFLWFNQNPGAPKLSPSRRNWFANADFRRAGSLGIRRAIVGNVFQGRAEEAWSLMPSSIRTWHAPSVRKYPYDPGQARRLLMEAGFSWIEEGGRTRLVDAGRSPAQFEIFCRSDQQWGRIAAVVQQDTRIQEILAEELPLVPLVNQNILVVASPSIQGLKPVPLFPHTLWNGWELSF